MNNIFERGLLIIISLLFMTGGCQCTNQKSAMQLPSELATQLDHLIESEMSSKNLPGVVVGVWIPARGNYLKAFGKANLATNTKRQVDDPFRIASITKTFTATVVLSLVDDGLLSTSDPLSKYLPDFPNAENITIRNLLRMRSGIADYADASLLNEWYNDVQKNYPPDTLIERMALNGNEFTVAGQQTVYCNGNYTILAKVAEIASGRNFAYLVNEKVLLPLNLKSSSYPEPDNYILGGSNRGYSWEDATSRFADKTEINTSCGNAAGAIISTMNDLTKYVRALYKGTLLSEATQQKRLEAESFEGAPTFEQYGEGIMKLGEFYGHNGTIFGFSTEMFYLPAEDAVIVINVSRLDLDDKSWSGGLFGEITRLVFPEHVSW
jgi:D-alanyl-D-alanine carboxypeptidase